MTESTKSDKILNLETQQKLLKNKQKKFNILAEMQSIDVALARGHAESVLLENLDLQENIEKLKGKKFKRAYILLLSTNTVCSACTNIIPAIKVKLSNKLQEEVGAMIDQKDIDLLYLPFKDQEKSEKKTKEGKQIGNIVVKRNSEEGIYKKGSSSITSDKPTKEPVSILFDKALGGDAKKDRIFSCPKSDKFDSLRKEDIDKAYPKPEEKTSRLGSSQAKGGKAKSSKSGSSGSRSGSKK